MKIIDITHGLLEAPIYPGSNPAFIERVADMQNGDMYNSSIVTAGSHMGTHADAYCHFLDNSDVTIDKMELWCYYGSCRVCAFAPQSLITREQIQPALAGTERLVIKGGGKTYLTKQAAEAIAGAGVAMLGTDAWSVAPLNNEAEIHHILLRAGVAIVENLALESAQPGEYTIAAFPAKYTGCDGAPVRAVLIQE